MEKWDKKENDKDEFMSLIKQVIPKLLEKEPIPEQTFHFSANLTKEQLKKVSEVLSK